MQTALAIAVVTVTVLSALAVLAAFLWAARKDGEEDREVQRRLGIRRKTRLGR